MRILVEKYNSRHYFKIMIGVIMIGMLILQVEARTVEDEVDEFIAYNARPEKIAYLTFDDGPSVYTTELLKILRKYEIPAIFFISGESIEVIPKSHQLLNKIIEEGHRVGLHSMTHDRNKLYNQSNSPQIFVEEMLELKQIIFEITGGYETNLCRAPYGKRNNFKAGHYEAVEEAGLYCIDWNVDSLDWSKKSTEQIYNQVVKELEKEDFPDQVVILFHEKKLTVKVLPQIIEYLQDAGYTFVPYLEGELIEVLN